MKQIINASCHVLGDNIDTDQIYPGKYLELTEHEMIAQHVLEGADPELPQRIRKGDILVCGRNFGCGSSREHAAITLKSSGVSLIIARSFARIFYRNAVNLGIPLLECKEDNIAEEGDELKVDVRVGTIENVSRHVSYPAAPLTDYMMQILESGGAVNMMKTKTVVVIATGGTIAGVADGKGDSSYHSGELMIEELIAGADGIDKIANLELHQFCNKQSDNLTQKEWLELAKLINRMGSRKDVVGFVITHGTNVMEETAYFLNLTLKVDQPVVLTGAMRPAADISPDGPRNLKQAVCVAASREASGRNVMVVFDGGIYGARDVQKQNTVSAAAFGQRDLGTQGYISGKTPIFYNTSVRCCTKNTEFDIADVSELPRVPIICFYIGADTALLKYAFEHSEGVIIAGAGNCGVSDDYIEIIEEYAGQGKVTVMSSRIENGPVDSSSSCFSGMSDKVISAGTLTPQKAKILLQLALIKTKDLSEMKEMFAKY